MVCERGVSDPSGLVSRSRFWLVSRNPGAMAFTRSPSPNLIASSPHIYFVQFTTAAFATPYPATRVRGRKADSDAMLIIEPCFCSTMAFTKTIVGMMVPNRLSSTTLRTASRSRSNIVLSGGTVAAPMLPPAPFINTSMRPYAAIMSL